MDIPRRGEFCGLNGRNVRVIDKFFPGGLDQPLLQVEDLLTKEKHNARPDELVREATANFDLGLDVMGEIDANILENTENTKPDGSKGRFYMPDQSEIDSMKKEVNRKGTVDQTRWAVKIFRDWLSSVGYDLDFEALPAVQLAERLEKFYTTVRTKSFQMYSKSAFKNIRCGLQRHLTSPPHSRNINLLQDSDFRQANLAYSGYMAKIRTSGRDVSAHKPVIEAEDIALLYDKVFTDTPVGLQRKVFYDILFHFGRRGREGLRYLKRDSFVLARDAAGHEYVTMSFNEAEKTRSGLNKDEEDTEKTMYSLPSDARRCPVESFKKYISLLNEQCEAFFQRPRRKVDGASPSWYENAPLGVNSLYGMMSAMSREGGLSCVYTNHSIRRTCVTTLDRAGYSAQKIQSVTGHKSAESLKHYLGGPSKKVKLSMSNALTNYGKKEEAATGSADSVKVGQSKMATATAVKAETRAYSSDEDDLQLTQTVTTNAAVNVQDEDLFQSLFGGQNTLNNCTFNITFNK